MSEVTVDQDVVPRELWHVEFRNADSDKWNPIGTEREDLPAVLRVHDYWVDNYPDVKLRLRRTDVRVTTADLDELRKRAAEMKQSTPQG